MLELKEKQERKEILEEDKMFNILYYVNKDELNMISDFKELKELKELKEGCIRIATNLYGKIHLKYKLSNKLLKQLIFNLLIGCSLLFAINKWIIIF